MGLPSNTRSKALLLQNEIVGIRRHLHSNPELGFEEVETARLAANGLASYGYTVKTGLAKTGLIADLGTGKGRIAIRADMDALPINEGYSSPYCSTRVGVMHACGHDAHVACALAAAHIAASQSPCSKIRILMQPASEKICDRKAKSGAWRMIEDEALDGVQSIISLHVDATIPAGKVGIVQESVSVESYNFKIMILQPQSDSARSGQPFDPIVIGSRLVQAIAELEPKQDLDADIFTVREFRCVGGEDLSRKVIIDGSFKTFSRAMRDYCIDALEEVCSMISSFGGEHTIEYSPASTSRIVDPAVTAVMMQAAKDLVGAQNVIALKRQTWIEDFSIYTQQVPGAFMLLGTLIQYDPRTHHSPMFDINESGLHIGAAVLAETALRLARQLPPCTPTEDFTPPKQQIDFSVRNAV